MIKTATGLWIPYYPLTFPKDFFKPLMMALKRGAAAGTLIRGDTAGTLVNDCGSGIPCDKCSGTTEDRNMQCVITGLSDHESCDDTPSCSDAFNGTHTLLPSPSTACTWTKSLSVCGSSSGQISMLIQTSHLSVTLHTSTGDGGWSKVITTPIDCSAFSSEDLGSPVDTVLGHCTIAGGGTCKITSL